ncbi:porin family protein [Phaeocystidibacter marisrubri]|uniref:PorT family protein n=1 Tax=Phaeocystidibacter marisrubri TaxID=1577780 RepID=A0A6L3ZKH0_9FLAO|nr:porin family protein [Phaeocystidibacter marisrubri]KAB2818193.1 PorT family protein [Phaeocystidibacter marisrubri]
MSVAAQSQILISLLFGDKLNSDGVEFGLDGGLAIPTLTQTEELKARYTLNLGMYFDIRIRESWFLHTGFIVKSPGGGANISPYTTGISSIDDQLDKSKVTRRLGYIHLPAFIRYRFPNFLFLEGGPQVGFMTAAYDRFRIQSGDNDLEYKHDLINQHHRWDAGLTVGVGYKLFHGRGITTGVRYYMGLTDVSKNDGIQQNRIGYIYVSIPIGRHDIPE